MDSPRFGLPGPNPPADMNPPPGPNPLVDFDPPSADLDPPTELGENIILNVLLEIDNTFGFSTY